MVSRIDLDAISITGSFDFEIRIAAFHSKSFRLIGYGNRTAVVIAEYNHRLSAYGRIKNPFARHKKIITVDQSYHYPYFIKQALNKDKTQ